MPSQVHQSLLDADNALVHQSARHPDGWGVAHYVNGTPHLIRSCETALSDTLFHRVGTVVDSETVVAHVRKATQGPKSVLNCHPFQHGRWVFAHNGDIENFDEVKMTLKQHVRPKFRRYLLGETDSEVIFGLFLTCLSVQGSIDEPSRVDEVLDALAETIKIVRKLSDRTGLHSLARLSVIVTDGTTLVAHQGGKELFWSTYTSKCSDPSDRRYSASECETSSETGAVSHLMISSEPLGGSNVWSEMAVGQFVGVDAQMQLTHREDPLTLPDTALLGVRCG